MRRPLPPGPKRTTRVRRHWPVWAFTLGLVLQAAAPWLAAVSAAQAGVAVAEVCTVWGVRTVSLGDAVPASRDGGTGPVAKHAATCALAGFVASGAPDSAGVEPVALTMASPAASARAAAAPIRDAAARWAARLHHAPPLFV